MDMPGIDNHIDFNLLTRLTETPGLPGREAPVAQLIKETLKSDLWQIHSDPIGNLIAHYPGTGPRLVLLAHMDEVGLIVRRIEADGYLKVERLGGMGIRPLPGNRLRLWTETGDLLSHVGTPAQHQDQPQFYDLTQLFIDIGSVSRGEAEALGVQVGDGLTWDSRFERMNQTNLIRGKAFDDRLGCYVLIELARLLNKKEKRLNFDLYFAFTVQEEIMLTGSLPTINDIRPDIAIGIDTTLASDSPDDRNINSEIILGHGPTFKLMDAIRGKMASYVPDRDLIQKFKKLAEINKIPIQYEIVTGLSTTLSPIPFSLSGIKSAAFSIPIRYHHSPIETADMRDLDYLIKLLHLIVTDMT